MPPLFSTMSSARANLSPRDNCADAISRISDASVPSRAAARAARKSKSQSTTRMRSHKSVNAPDSSSNGADKMP